MRYQVTITYSNGEFDVFRCEEIEEDSDETVFTIKDTDQYSETLRVPLRGVKHIRVVEYYD